MLIRLDTKGSVPIYVQLRNQIVMGIGRGELKAGERLPTVRQMAAQTGINAMTVNKAYQILKAEGFIEIDRRHGAAVSQAAKDGCFREKLEWELELVSAEARSRGIDEPEFLELCARMYRSLRPETEPV